MAHTRRRRQRHRGGSLDLLLSLASTPLRVSHTSSSRRPQGTRRRRRSRLVLADETRRPPALVRMGGRQKPVGGSPSPPPDLPSPRFPLPKPRRERHDVRVAHARRGATYSVLGAISAGVSGRWRDSNPRPSSYEIARRRSPQSGSRIRARPGCSQIGPDPLNMEPRMEPRGSPGSVRQPSRTPGLAAAFRHGWDQCGSLSLRLAAVLRGAAPAGRPWFQWRLVSAPLATVIPRIPSLLGIDFRFARRFSAISRAAMAAATGLSCLRALFP